MSSNCLVFHTSGRISSSPAAFLFLIFLDYGLRTSIDKIKENGFELTKRRSRKYPATTITDADYADDIAILANTPDQAETLLHSLERAAASIGLHVNAHKTEYMCYNQTGDISTLEGTPLKLVDKFTYLGSSVESTEKDIETRLTKAWTAINRLSIIWKSDLTDKMKSSFFQAAVTSILLYGCTTWTLTKRLEKKLDGNYTRMLRAILNKSWQQHPTRHQLYGHLPPITKTIQVRRTRHAGHCWRSRDELIRDVLLWIPTHGRSKAGRPARTYIQQLCEDTGCCPEDLPRAMNDREEWRENVRDIRAASTIWWWWWWWWWYLPSSGFIHTAIWMHYMDTNYTYGEKTLMAATQECCKQYWASLGGSTPQSSSCTATYHPSRELSKFDKPDIRDNAGEVSGPVRIAEQSQYDSVQTCI